MRTLAIILLVVVGSLSCIAAEADSAATIPAERLVGKWYRGDGTGSNVTITFNKDLSYSAVWQGCLGTYGTARGTWRIQRGEVNFTPTEEKDMMRKHLRMLNIEQTEKGLVLVPPDVRKEFKRYGTSSRYWCFQPVKGK